MNEDWQAVIIGVALIVLAFVGAIGKAKGIINIPW
jgi:hypothetical protein